MLWIPLRLPLGGGIAWIIAALLALRDPEPPYRRRTLVLLGTIGLLALAPINTDTGTRHFLVLGAFFFTAVAAPTLVLRRSDPGVIAWNVFPKRFRARDLIYVIISVPLSWLVFEIYFFHVSPGVPAHWHLPPVPSAEATWRLIAGINCVGIWDELFFINLVYGVLRSIYPKRIAMAGQAVVYTSVLTRMAFTGLGPFLVALLALTQAAMYEGSRSLLYVIVVHLIIDFFLVAAILHYYYPATHLGAF